MNTYFYDGRDGGWQGQQFVPPPIPRVEVSNSRLWYAAVLPFISLFIEIYATNVYLGVLVWVCAVAFSIFACAADLRYIRRLGIETGSLPAAFAAIPPLYIYKRTKLTYSKVTPMIICVVGFVYALIFNGFTTMMTMSPDDYSDQIRNAFFVSIEGYEDDSDASALGTIGEELETHFGKDGKSSAAAEKSAEDADEFDFEDYLESVRDKYDDEDDDDAYLKWSAKKKGGAVYVTAESDDESVKIVFRMESDGYKFGNITVEELKNGAESYEGKDADEQFHELVKEMALSKSDPEDDDSSSQAD